MRASAWASVLGDVSAFCVAYVTLFVPYCGSSHVLSACRVVRSSHAGIVARATHDELMMMPRAICGGR